MPRQAIHPDRAWLGNWSAVEVARVLSRLEAVGPIVAALGKYLDRGVPEVDFSA
jgi:hypothetical protein